MFLQIQVLTCMQMSLHYTVTDDFAHSKFCHTFFLHTDVWHANVFTQNNFYKHIFFFSTTDFYTQML